MTALCGKRLPNSWTFAFAACPSFLSHDIAKVRTGYQAFAWQSHDAFSEAPAPRASETCIPAAQANKQALLSRRPQQRLQRQQRHPRADDEHNHRQHDLVKGLVPRAALPAPRRLPLVTVSVQRQRLHISTDFIESYYDSGDLTKSLEDCQ